MSTEDMQDPAKDSILVEPLLVFASNLFQSIGKPSDNVIFSPLSIHICLNMLSLGVTRGSQTGKELNVALGYTNIDDSSLEKIHEVNARLGSLFTGSGASNNRALLGMVNYMIASNVRVEQAYIDKAEKHYRSSVKQINSPSDKHKVIGEINDWCKKAGLSEDFLRESDLADSHLVLINALRVESSWFRRFIRTKGIFHNYGRQDDSTEMPLGLRLHSDRVVFFELTRNTDSLHEAINAAVRNRNPKIYDELAALECRVIKIDLIGHVSYTLVEPLKTVDGKELEVLEKGLMGALPEGGGVTRMSMLNDLIDMAPKVLVNLTMPGFKFEQDVDLKSHLASIGLARLFDRLTLEDTRDITPLGVMVDEARHRAMIDVGENGIKAAAITKMVMVTNSCLQRDRPIDIKVENPFMFLLRLHRLPLFVGHFVYCC